VNSKLEKFLFLPGIPPLGQDTPCSEVKLELDFENGILCLLHCLVGQNAFQCQRNLRLNPRICRIRRLFLACSFFTANSEFISRTYRDKERNFCDLVVNNISLHFFFIYMLTQDQNSKYKVNKSKRQTKQAHTAKD
jgi:hypothetical protein